MENMRHYFHINSLVLFTQVWFHVNIHVLKHLSHIFMTYNVYVCGMFTNFNCQLSSTNSINVTLLSVRFIIICDYVIILDCVVTLWIVTRDFFFFMILWFCMHYVYCVYMFDWHALNFYLLTYFYSCFYHYRYCQMSLSRACCFMRFTHSNNVYLFMIWN